MTWKQIYGWIVVAVISCSTTMALVGDSITGIVGDPCIVNFGYDGPRHGVNFRFSKDGKPFVAERFRVFQRLQRLSFAEVTESDAGVYTLAVDGRGIRRWRRSITLLGM